MNGNDFLVRILQITSASERGGYQQKWELLTVWGNGLMETTYDRLDEMLSKSKAIREIRK